MAENSNSYILEPFIYNQHYKNYKRIFEQSNRSVAPPKESLPINGLVIENKAYGFLALTDCNFGFLCWYTVNNEINNSDKYECLKLIFQGIEEVAKINNKSFLFCFSTKRSIISLIKTIGYYEMGGGHLGKRI